MDSRELICIFKKERKFSKHAKGENPVGQQRVNIQVHNLMLLFFSFWNCLHICYCSTKEKGRENWCYGNSMQTDLRVTLTVQATLVLWELDADRLEGNSYCSSKTGVMGTRCRWT